MDDSEVLDRGGGQCPCDFYRPLPGHPGTLEKDKDKGLVISACHNKSCRLGGLRAGVYVLTGVEAGSLRSRYWQDCFLLAPLSLVVDGHHHVASILSLPVFCIQI